MRGAFFCFASTGDCTDEVLVAVTMKAAISARWNDLCTANMKLIEMARDKVQELADKAKVRKEALTQESDIFSKT